MKWHAYHNGQKIPYLLGILLGLDQFLGCFVPGADVDKTPSHRIGVKRACPFGATPWKPRSIGF
jgi:hypothetical protein